MSTNTKKTSEQVSSLASQTLLDKTSSKTAKILAGSALSQVQKRGDKQKGVFTALRFVLSDYL